MDIQRDFDLLDIPMEGVAAYWLSLKQLHTGKRNAQLLLEEAAYTTEPYVKYLLETAFSSLDDTRIRDLAAAKAETLLTELGRKLDLMRLALLDIAATENPRKSLAKMTAKFAAPPLREEQAFQLAQELAQVAGETPNERSRYVNVSHRLRPDKLIVVLLFYVIWSRHQGKIGCEPLLQHIDSAFFADGLSLAIDGFDAPFLRKRLRVHRDSILAETHSKMRMAAAMCLGIRAKLSYEEIFHIAKAYMT